jgi:hypothetical protein
MCVCARARGGCGLGGWMGGRHCALNFHTPMSATGGSLLGMNARRSSERKKNGEEDDIWRRYS